MSGKLFKEIQHNTMLVKGQFREHIDFGLI